MADRKKILILGLNYFMRVFVEEASSRLPCIAVDSNEALRDTYINNPNVTLYIGDVNSIVLWKKLPLNEISHIVYSISDYDVAEELCRIIRETFKLDLPIIAISHQQKQNDFYTKYNVTSIDPVAVGVASLKVMIEQNYAVPANIGLGKGEIVEVSILRNSHLVGRKLRYMEASRWKVGAIYRDGALILPEGDIELNIGDKVVLVGDPLILKNIVKTLMQGIPKFPLQYGNNINVMVYGDAEPVLSEANYVRSITQAKVLRVFGTQRDLDKAAGSEIIKSMSPQIMPALKNYKSLRLFNDAGVVVVPPRKSFIHMLRIRWLMRRQTAPLLLAKDIAPYGCILALLNATLPSEVLQVAIELSRLAKLPLRVVYVAAPKSLRNAKQEDALAYRQRLVRDYEGIERISIEYTVCEGNPVKEFVRYQQKYPKALVVVDNDPSNKISPLDPHIPFLLSERLHCSMLVLPALPE